MSQRYNLILRVFLAAWMILGACVLDSEAQLWDIPNREAYEERRKRDLEHERRANEFFEKIKKEREEVQRINKLKKSEEEVSKLIVMIQGQLGAGPTIGAGFIFGREKDQIYIATANHVVRRGALNARDLQIKLVDLPDEFLPATLTDHFDEDLDLAVLRVEGLRKRGIDGCTLPMHHLGDGSVLERGDALYPIGYPNGVPWGMPIVPDRVSKIAGREITFQSSFISIGHSGGGLLNETYDLVGMIIKDGPPFGLAIQLKPILKVLQQWGYPVKLYVFRNDGKTPLYRAAENGDLTGVKRLLDDECVNVNEKASWDSTALSAATWTGNIEIVKLLLEEGADPRIGNPIVGAAHSGQVSMIELLLTNGATVSMKEYALSPLQAAILEGHIAIVRLLLYAGADVNVKGLWHHTPLQDAVEKRHTEIMRLLLAAGADAKQKGLLHEAMHEDELEIVKLLLEHGADVNVDFNGETVLNHAVREGKVEAIKILLNAGANPNMLDKRSGKTTHDLARENKKSPTRDTIINLLSSHEGKE
ncbi:MAG: ankyrin repeat domain-containing protein [Proteobacteria bacterium]|nr:ankyrin repeat domain-containing protein [Pseudomonadota bacterium]